MGWESRRNGTYYYAKERCGSRVESSYLGRGDVAQAIALLNEARRAERRAEREAERAEIEKMREEDAAFDQVDALVMDLTKAHLIEAGFHQAKRVWRKKR
jgi:hypothetical protein